MDTASIRPLRDHPSGLQGKVALTKINDHRTKCDPTQGQPRDQG